LLPLEFAFGGLFFEKLSRWVHEAHFVLDRTAKQSQPAPCPDSLRRRRLPLQPSSVALSLSPQKHFHALSLQRGKSAVFRQHLTADAAQPVATAVDDRTAPRTAPLTRFNLAGCILAAEDDRQVLLVVAIGPSNI
jgi:hypothetical protein